MGDYVPVSCDFHDELESLATLQQECLIFYHNETGDVVERRDRIADIYAANKADYLKLTDGTEIRLDQLVSVNGKLPSDSAN
jgi:Rho-binding antiterminator